MNAIAMPSPREMYRAIENKDESYEGIFIIGVKTTGIFCRPGCPARTPKIENIEFFANAQGALLAGYRPCRRCRPLTPAGHPPDDIAGLIEAVEREPERRWRDEDIRARGLEPARVRRWFQKHHGMTFHAFARARRLGTALGQIRAGDDATGAAFDHGYESLSGFREAFRKLFGEPPGRVDRHTQVWVNRIRTPLGPMLAGVTDEALVLLEYVDRRMLETQIGRLRRHLGAAFVPGENAVTTQIETELREYFDGERRTFTVPVRTPGSAFQQRVWDALREIPHGETRSYADVARVIGKPSAVRAVGTANGDNRLAIVIPCHRVVRSDGTLGGYGGQLWRKKALLALERGD